MTDLFQPTPQDDIQDLDPNKNYYDDLVGEGKPFSTNEALARSKVESNLFIERLKTEQAGLRQELNSRVKMEEFLERLSDIERHKLNSIQQTKSPTSNEQDGPGAKQADALTPEDITQLLDNKLSERERLNKATQNVELVKQKLQESLGPNYATKLEQMTNTLGLSKEFLNNVASTSPSAFLKLVGLDSQKQTDLFTSPPKNQLSTGFKPTTGEKNWDYFEDIRKKDPKKYWTPSVQNEMHLQAHKLGEAFKS